MFFPSESLICLSAYVTCFVVKTECPECVCSFRMLNVQLSVECAESGINS